MTSYAGKRVERRVLDRENAERLDDHHLLCCWDTCDRYGLEIFKVRVKYGTPGVPYDTWYVFCSERHKMYWVNSTRDLYNLPPGYKRAVV